jgi:hypothetical protein
MKLDAAQYADDGPAERLYTFTHESLPGVEFPITLVFPGLLEEGDVREAQAVYRAEYLQDGKRGKFMVASGDERQANGWVCDDVSMVFALQGGAPAGRYQWQELGDIATTRRLKPLWDQASATCIALLNGKLLPNSPGPGDGPSSNGSEPQPASSIGSERTGETPAPTPAISSSKGLPGPVLTTT